MKKFVLTATAAAALALVHPAFASEIDDLKAEIATQRAAAAAQQARLDALEQRLDAASAAAPPARKAAAVSPAMSTDQNGVKLVDAPSGVALYDNGNTSLHMYGLIEATGSHANHQSAAAPPPPDSRSPGSAATAWASTPTMRWRSATGSACPA